MGLLVMSHQDIPAVIVGLVLPTSSTSSLNKPDDNRQHCTPTTANNYYKTTFSPKKPHHPASAGSPDFRFSSALVQLAAPDPLIPVLTSRIGSFVNFMSQAINY